MGFDSTGVKLAIEEEGTYGTNPGSGFRFLRYTSEDLRLDRGVTQSGEISGDRNPVGSIATSKSLSGGFSTELSLVPSAASPGNGYDMLYEGAFMSDWSVEETGAALDLDITTAGTALTEGGNAVFEIIDGGASAPFATVAAGQWLKLTGYPVNGTVYARVLEVADSDTIYCEGCRSDGVAVTAESGALSISFTGSYMRTSTTKKSYSLERQYTDSVLTNEYTEYTGLWVSTWQRSVSPDALVTEQWTFNGKTANTSTSSTTGGSETAKWSTPRVNAVDDIAWILESDWALAGGNYWSAKQSDCITSISHTLDNAARIDLCIGEDGPQGVGIGNPTFDGNITAFMPDGDWLRAHEDRTFKRIAYLVDDGTNQQMVTIYKALFTNVTANASGNDAPVEVAADFSAEATELFNDAATPNPNIAVQIDRF